MMIFDNLTLTWPWHPIALILWIMAALLYIFGWRRAATKYPQLATVRRLVYFIMAMLLIAIAFFSPLDPFSHHLLAARTLQKVILAMVAPLLVWLSVPFHIMVHGLPAKVHPWITRNIIRPSALRSALRLCTRPTVAWLCFISLFLIWHDPRLVAWSLENENGRMMVLGLLFGTALLYWQHVYNSGPRIHKRYPGWLFVAYLIAVEIPNMAAGISLAFTEQPLYPAYVAAHEAGRAPSFLNVQEDQMLSGAMVWVTGSIVYISSAVAVLSRLFLQEDADPPRLSASTTATRRTIAPGLEHRAVDS